MSAAPREVERAFEQVVSSRYSCRAFRAEPLDTARLDRLLSLAQHAPSWCNTQPWRVTLVSGRATADFAAALLEHVVTSAPRSDLSMDMDYEGVYQERRRESGLALYESVGITHGDAEGRQRQALRNFEFFGAPHVAVVHTDRALGLYGAVDCGGYVTALLLAAQACGVDSVAMASIAMYSDLVRRHLDLGEDRQVVCAVGLGLADEGHPANGFRTSRADLDEVVETRS